MSFNRRIASVFCETSEDWYPSYQLAVPDARYSPKLVSVSFLLLHTKQWRVCVWGADDLGMEKDFPADQFVDAKVAFDEVISLTNVTKDRLEQMGFVYA